MFNNISQEKIFKYFILGVGIICLIILMTEVVFKAKEINIPEVSQPSELMKINWDIFTEPLKISPPEFSVDLSIRQGTSSRNVTLSAVLNEKVSGSFRYKFDCQSDGEYDSVSPKIPDRSYRTECSYSEDGSYKVSLIVEGLLDYYQEGEKKTKEITASAEKEIIVSSNLNPVISLCRVEPSEGFSQDNFQFNFKGKAIDPDGDELEFKWEFGDGETSNRKQTPHFYKKTGVFTPKLIVNDNRGGQAVCIPSPVLTLGRFSDFESLELPDEIGRNNPFTPY